MSSADNIPQSLIPGDLRSRILAAPTEILSAISQISTAKTDEKNHDGSSLFIQKGSRNDSLFKMACKLRKMDLTEASVLDAVSTINKNQAVPPLSGDEVASIIQSAFNYDKQSPGSGSQSLEELINYHSHTKQWAEIIPLISKTYTSIPFDKRMTPLVILNFAESLTNGLQVPVEAAIKIAISALSAVTGKRYQIRAKRDFLLSANLSCLLIAPPSCLKSPLQKNMLGPIYSIEQDLIKQNAILWQEYESKKEGWDLESAVLKKEFKDKKTNTQRKSEILERIRELKRLGDQGPILRRLCVSDITTEKLLEVFQMNPYGLLMVWDEIAGLFAVFEKQGRESDRKLLLSAISGDLPHSQDRIGRGTISVNHLLATVIGGIQPEILKERIYKSLVDGSGEDGLIQRFPLLAFIDLSPNYELIETVIPTEVADDYYSMFRKLFVGQSSSFSSETDFEISEKNPAELTFHEFSFDDEAQALFNAWLTALEVRLRTEKFINLAFQAHLGKFRKLYPSLALLFFLAENVESSKWEDKKISRRYVEMAHWWCDYLEQQAYRLYSMFFATKESAADLLLAKIKDGYITSGFSVREVVRSQWKGLRDPTLVRDALRTLEGHNYLVVLEAKEKSGRGSPSIFLNPSVFKKIGDA